MQARRHGVQPKRAFQTLHVQGWGSELGMEGELCRGTDAQPQLSTQLESTKEGGTVRSVCHSKVGVWVGKG